MNYNAPWSNLKNAAIAITMAPVCVSWPILVFLCGMALLFLLTAAIFRCTHAAHGKLLKRFCRSKEIPPSKIAASVSSFQHTETENDTAKLLLLRHVNHRISSYLKMAWPDAKWEWCTNEPEALALTGGIGRIRIWGIPDFDYADILVDRQANITCDLIKPVPLAVKPAETPQQKEPAPEKKSANPQIWYELQGRKILEPLVTDLNSRGYNQLMLGEDGSAYVEEGGKKVTKGHFDHFPKESSWPRQVQVLEGNGLAAKVTTNDILISW